MVRILFSVILATAIMFIYTGRGISQEDAFTQASREAVLKDGVKEIAYDQFMKIKDSKERYVLLDVLSTESYKKGHIPGAQSFPADIIDVERSALRLSKDSKVIVYCASFQCGASTAAAKKLISFGYNILDYKGGLKDWQDKGNSLEK